MLCRAVLSTKGGAYGKCSANRTGSGLFDSGTAWWASLSGSRAHWATEQGVTQEVLLHRGVAGACGSVCGACRTRDRLWGWGFRVASANALTPTSLYCLGAVSAVFPTTNDRWDVSTFFRLWPSFLVYKIERVGV